MKNSNTYVKKTLTIVTKAVVGFLGLVVCYVLIALGLSRITVEQEPNTVAEVSIYILTNGVHTDLVVPIKSDVYDWSKEVKFANTASKDTNFHYLAMGWGDKGFYLETPEWKDLSASVALKAAFALSSTAIHTTFYKRMVVGKECKKIGISKEQYKRLIDYINVSFQKDNNGHFVKIATNAVYGKNDAFYEANGHYSIFHTCNTWANNGLKQSGQKCCFWTPFDTGIFLQYE